MVTFDTLKAARRLQDEAGFNETQASVLVAVLAECHANNPATKGDLAHKFGTVHSEVAASRTGFLADMRAFEHRLYVRVGAMISGATLYLTAVIGIATAILLNAL